MNPADDLFHRAARLASPGAPRVERPGSDHFSAFRTEHHPSSIGVPTFGPRISFLIAKEAAYRFALEQTAF